jgi:hypothetical protein
VAAQRSFEAATERVALYERDAMRANTETGVECVNAANALTGILQQALAIIQANETAEQFQVAAQIECIAIRREYDVGQGRIGIVTCLQAAGQVALVGQDVVDQLGRETGSLSRDSVGVHVAPVDAAPRIFNDAQGMSGIGPGERMNG